MSVWKLVLHCVKGFRTGIKEEALQFENIHVLQQFTMQTVESIKQTAAFITSFFVVILFSKEHNKKLSQGANFKDNGILHFLFLHLSI